MIWILPLLIYESNFTYKINIGSITYHLTDLQNAGQANTPKLNTDGTLIANPLLGYSVTDTYNGTYTEQGVFLGNNSVGGQVYGFQYKLGTKTYKQNTYGFIFGGYFQNHKDFTSKNIKPFRLVQIEDVDLVPIVGLFYNYRLSERITLDTAITPVLVNSTIGWEF